MHTCNVGTSRGESVLQFKSPALLCLQTQFNTRMMKMLRKGLDISEDAKVQWASLSPIRPWSLSISIALIYHV